MSAALSALEGNGWREREGRGDGRGERETERERGRERERERDTDNRDRDRERETARGVEGWRKSERERVDVCVRERGRERIFVLPCLTAVYQAQHGA